LTCDRRRSGRTVGSRTRDAVKVLTIKGKVFFLPNEVLDQIAAVINSAVAALNV